jgi:thiol-disulfide isomerase/thioredoxin
MRINLKRSAGIAIVAFASAVIAVAVAGKPVSLSFKDLHGNKTKLTDLRGKVVVVNFWATWCGPCDAEMPMLVQTASSYAGKNVAFVGVSLDEKETQDKIPAYLTKRHVEYPIWVGATDYDLNSLKLGKAVPATMFIDASGVIKSRILGQMRPGEIEQRVDWLLNGEQGTPPPAEVTHLDAK